MARLTRITAREEFIAVVRGEKPPGLGHTACVDAARALLASAKRLHTIAEQRCNGVGENEEARLERAELKARAEAAEAATKIGARVVFSGDPRGAVVKLKLASGIGNCFGDSTLYCVPTRG